MSGRWIDLGNSSHTNIALQEGIRALEFFFGDNVCFLRQVKTRKGELATFEFPLPPDYLEISRDLIIGFPENFPSVQLQLQVTPSSWLAWPHTLPDFLCLYGAGQKPAYGDPIKVVNDTLRRFSELVKLIVPTADENERRAHFEREIQTYWNHQLDSSVQQLVLVNQPAEAGPLYALTDQRLRSSMQDQIHWLAKEKSALQAHLARQIGKVVRIPDPVQAGFYLRLLSVPPVKIPDARDFLEWLKPHIQPDVFEQLENWKKDSERYPIRWVLAEIPGATKSVVQAFILRSAGIGLQSRRAYGRRAARRISSQYTPSMSRRLQGASVNVLSDQVVHSRFWTDSTQSLRGKKVAMIGVGSLGSPVASQLLRAGVGEIILIDPDDFTDANLGRHVLGADDLGQMKATALGERLRRDFPLAKVQWVSTYFEFKLIADPTYFDDVDIVITTTAEWGSEDRLWLFKQKLRKWGHLQAWSEPHAFVGHALYAPATDLKHPGYLFDENGRFLHRYSEWIDDGIHLQPACGASFVPAGPIALAAISTMVADLAVDALTGVTTTAQWRSLIGSSELVKEAGGTYCGPELPAGIRQMILSRSWPSQ